MKKESDLDGVKAIAKALLMTDICKTIFTGYRPTPVYLYWFCCNSDRKTHRLSTDRYNTK